MLTVCVCVTFTFSPLLLLIRYQEERPWVSDEDKMLAWLSVCARCISFAYGLADATAIPGPRHLLPYESPERCHLSDTGLPMLLGKGGC